MEMIWRVEQGFGRGRQEQLPKLQQRREERRLEKRGEKRRKKGGEREKADHGNEKKKGVGCNFFIQ